MYSRAVLMTWFFVSMYVGACVVPEEGAVEQPETITDGSPVSGAEVEAIVGLEGLPAAPSCTGTFVHPRYVLTAAHCLPDCSRTLTRGCVARQIPKQVIGIDGPFTRGASTEDAAPYSYDEFRFDYVYFPRNEDYDWQDAPDVALLHTTDYFRGDVISVLPWGLLPTSGSVCNRWGGHGIDVVGYSPNEGTERSMRRRGRFDITCTVHFDQIVELERGSTRTCRGDSGGPGLWRDKSGNYLLGGVVGLHRYEDQGDNCLDGESVSTLSFIPRHFLDRIARADRQCVGRAWDECDEWQRSLSRPRAPEDPRAVRGSSGIDVSWTDHDQSGASETIVRREQFMKTWTFDTRPGERRHFVDDLDGLRTDVVYYYYICTSNSVGRDCSEAIYRPF